MLDNLTDFVSAIYEHGRDHSFSRRTILGEMYCPVCAGNRGMTGVALYSPALLLFNSTSPPPDSNEFWKQLPPSLFRLICVQCDSDFTVVIYESVEGRAMAVFSPHAAGASTPHTPKPVAYYLDQANRAQSVGANSAAVAMYRGALDQLLFDQGFKNGMLGKKLEQLEKATADGTAPKWVMELDTEYLSALNQLGSGSIQLNDGDIAKQQELDNELLIRMREAFQGLLFHVYEVPHLRKSKLDALKNKAALLKKP